MACFDNERNGCNAFDTHSIPTIPSGPFPSLTFPHTLLSNVTTQSIDRPVRYERVRMPPLRQSRSACAPPLRLLAPAQHLQQQLLIHNRSRRSSLVTSWIVIAAAHKASPPHHQQQQLASLRLSHSRCCSSQTCTSWATRSGPAGTHPKRAFQLTLPATKRSW